jgi:hypothetical protein
VQLLLNRVSATSHRRLLMYTRARTTGCHPAMRTCNRRRSQLHLRRSHAVTQLTWKEGLVHTKKLVLRSRYIEALAICSECTLFAITLHSNVCDSRLPQQQQSRFILMCVIHDCRSCRHSLQQQANCACRLAVFGISNSCFDHSTHTHS